MKRGHLRGMLLALLCIILLACIVFFYFHDAETPAVTLPAAPSDSGGSHETDELGNGLYLPAKVKPSTVQATIRTLSRAAAYSRTVTAESFWDGGSSAKKLECHVREGDMRLAITGDGDAKNLLVLGSTLYIWYSDSSRIFETTILDPGDTALDEYTGILTYEELLELDVSQISDAGYTKYADEMCIYAEYTAGVLGYTSRVYVSIDTGLLMGAERYDGDTIIYRMTSDAPVIDTPEDSFFTAPS